MAHRTTLTRAIREAPDLGTVRVRVSSRAAEAAKCLADPAIVAVLLVDSSADIDAVRRAAEARDLGRHCYVLEARDRGDVVVRLVRSAVESQGGEARTRRGY
jgi:hypothetical protein